MSHIKLTVLISTDGDDFAQRRETSGAHHLMKDVLEWRVSLGLDCLVSSGRIYDVSGNDYGEWDLVEVKD